MGRLQDVLEVMDPFEVGDGAPPCDDDVAAPKAAYLLLVGGDGDVAHPVGVLAPDAAHAGLLEEVGEVDVGGGVEVSREGVAAVRHAQPLEEMGALVFAGAAVFGVGVEVEGVVASLRHLPVADNFLPEMRVHGVQQIFPVVLALDFSPDLVEGAGVFHAQFLLCFFHF